MFLGFGQREHSFIERGNWLVIYVCKRKSKKRWCIYIYKDSWRLIILKCLWPYGGQYYEDCVASTSHKVGAMDFKYILNDGQYPYVFNSEKLSLSKFSISILPHDMWRMIDQTQFESKAIKLNLSSLSNYTNEILIWINTRFTIYNMWIFFCGRHERWEVFIH